MEELIRYEKVNSVGKIIINRPNKMNSITRDMGIKLNELSAQINHDNEVKVVLLTGEGERAFSTGSDINMLNQYGNPFELKNRDDYCEAIRNIKKPVICKIKGYALGGGLELVLATDIRIAADNAKFGVSEVKHGWISGSGATQLLARELGYSNAAYLTLTGEMFGASDAFKLGLVNKVISLDKIDDFVDDLLNNISKSSSTSMQLTKQNLRASQNMPMDMGLKYENDLFAFSMTTKDAEEGKLAFKEKRDPVFN